MARPHSPDFGGLDGIDLGQVTRHTFPLPSLVATHPQLATGGTEVEAHAVLTIRRHCLALDCPPRLAGRQPGIATLPAFAAVLRGINCWLSARAGARPHLCAVHWENPYSFWIAWMNDHREADVTHFLRHALADAN